MSYAREAAELRSILQQQERILAHAVGQPITAAAPVRIVASPTRSATTYANAVEELRARHAQSVANAESAVAAPEMFAGSGDYALATASGIDPAAVNVLPWRARLAAAWEPSRAKAFRLTQDFGDADGEAHAALELGSNAAVRRYVSSVESWYATAGIGSDPGDLPELTPEDDAALFGDRAGKVIAEPQRTQSDSE
jgi:hypothetical protein